MDGAGRYLGALLLSPAVVLAVHAALCRLVRRAGGGQASQRTALSAVALALPIIALAAWHVRLRYAPRVDVAWEALYGLLVYGGLSYSYFHVFNISETSRRLRILQEVWSGADLASLEAACAPSDQVSVRLQRLTDMGELRLTGGRYVLASRRLLIAAIALETWARILGFGPASADQRDAAGPPASQGERT